MAIFGGFKTAEEKRLWSKASASKPTLRKCGFGAWECRGRGIIERDMNPFGAYQRWEQSVKRVTGRAGGVRLA